MNHFFGAVPFEYVPQKTDSKEETTEKHDTQEQNTSTVDSDNESVASEISDSASVSTQSTSTLASPESKLHKHLSIEEVEDEEFASFNKNFRK